MTRLTNLLFSIILIISFTACIEDQESTALQICDDETIQESLALLGEYQASDLTDFVTLEGNQFTLSGEPYPVSGINYYPAQYPWRRFLTETDLDSLASEFDLLKQTGFNTLRIFLWNTALFNCPGSGAVPNWGVFQRLDGIIRASARADFRLIVTLNDLPDLVDYPLYDNPTHIQEQTRFIVDRYKDEAAIIAWDMRNEGDIDYGTHNTLPGNFEKENVLKWLDETSTLIREIDSNHLITAGWLHDSQSTAPYVDFVSFHHWSSSSDLLDRLNEIKSETDKPILLQEFGYSTYRPDISNDRQRDLIAEVIETTEDENLLGWMIWTAFDFPRTATCFPSPCESADNAEHHFGIWESDYTPKPAAEYIWERENAPNG